ncbi:MAG: hypothetical protein OZSIB_1343 [Candidatus Ozemobacter sibiricus]|uniref:Uncharacterized protein n=1 Tax=Candidatus Ozemobacter sibiricus TaxID=2268124 RepID=A0A367ZMQ0_9BACT|nr:MAG: hypothetical protein OZSIB_1343 [Candidatus Ozemobacter sibiricus]
MASLVQDKIRAILKAEGKGILLNFLRFDQLLREALPDFRREAFVIARLLEAGVPQAFQLAAHRLDLDFLQAQFQNVISLYRFSEEAISLGFSAWAHALDLPYPPDCNTRTLMAGLPDRTYPPLGNRVAHGLAELMLRYGQTTCFAKNWLEARLKKTFPLYRGEVFLLGCLLERKVPQELVTLGKGRPIDPILPRLENRILAEIPFDPTALRWGIESWGFALGLDIPPHSLVLTNTLIKVSRSDAPKPTVTAGPKEEKPALASPPPSSATSPEQAPEPPLLRPAFVYILILTTCLLIYNQGVLMKEKQRLEKAAVPAPIRPFLPPEEGEEPLQDDTEILAKLPRVDGPEAFRLGLRCFNGETGQVDKTLARAYFRMAAEQGAPGAKAYLAYMLMTGDGGVDDQEGADRIMAELEEQEDRIEQARLYDLLRRSAYAGNPIAEKVVQDLKDGVGPFNLSALPPATMTRDLWKMVATSSLGLPTTSGSKQTSPATDSGTKQPGP